jgi:hypothetical protein
VTHDIGADSISVALSDIPVLTGDIKIMFFCSDKVDIVVVVVFLLYNFSDNLISTSTNKSKKKHLVGY